MDDSKYGAEDSRGYWKPNEPLRYPEVFFPPQPLGILKWAKGYLFPFGLFYGALAIFVWTFLTPDVARMKTLSFDWVFLIYLRNMGLIIGFTSIQHYWFYVKRAQGTTFKFNRKWPVEKNPAFTFGTQMRDNLFWTFAYGVPIWTAWEVATHWMMANGYIAGLNFADHGLWLVVLWFFVPLFQEFHFFWVHKLIHWPPLYKRVHKVHHRNMNPGPWSGLAMHPIEHIIYFSNILIYWVIPCHPLLYMHHTMAVGLLPANGHTGFDRIVTGEETNFHLPYYAHYLHHRLVDVNYADGTIPLDKWFGSFHNGSPEADEALKQRRIKMRLRANSQTTAGVSK